MKLELNLDWRRTVKTLMTAKNLSTSELAKAVGTTDASIRQVITKSTRGPMLNKVSEVLGITNDEVQHIVIEVDCPPPLFYNIGAEKICRMSV